MKYSVRLFKIYYRPKQNKYYFKPLNLVKVDKCVFYRKIANKAEIAKRNIFFFGNSAVAVTKRDNDFLNIEVVDKVKKTFFELLPDSSKEYCIGRANADITLPFKSISKKHASLKYSGGSWILTDGFSGVKSKLGIWELIDSKICINETMIIRMNNDIFRISMI